MSEIELDRNDLLLLMELQRNSNLTNAELAERVHLSASACLRRVQRLEKEGIIQAYRAHLQPEALGIQLQAFIRVQLSRHDADTIRTFSGHIVACDEVKACYALTGEMDYLMHVAVRDLNHYSQFLLDELLARPEIKDVNSSFVLRTLKVDRGYPITVV